LGLDVEAAEERERERERESVGREDVRRFERGGEIEKPLPSFPLSLSPCPRTPPA